MKASERVLKEEYREAQAALAFDGDPGVQSATVFASLIAAAFTAGGTVAHPALFIPALTFWGLTWWAASRVRAHRRTIQRWRDQERERLALEEAERAGKSS